MEIAFRNEVYIESRIEDVYAYVSKMENFSDWNYAVMSVEPIEKDNPKSSGDYLLKRDLGSTIEIEKVTVLETVNNQTLHFQAAGGRFSYEMKYEFQQSGTGTILINEAVMKPKRVSGIVLALWKSNIQVEVNKNMNVLKQQLENR